PNATRLAQRTLPRRTHLPNLRKECMQGVEIDRLHEVLVEAGGSTSFAVLLAAVSRDRDHGDPLPLREGAHLADDLVPAHLRESDVHKGEVRRRGSPPRPCCPPRSARGT